MELWTINQIKNLSLQEESCGHCRWDMSQGQNKIVGVKVR